VSIGSAPRAIAVHLQVANLVREQINTLQLRPGDRLIEREICESTGFSRPAVREGLRLLESEGLLSSSLAKGIRVTEIDWPEAQAVYELRGSLEALAARLFTEKATRTELRELRKAVRLVAAAGDNLPKFHAGKEVFYRVLLDGARNPVLTQMLASLNMRVRYLRSTSLSVPGRMARSLAEVQDILKAIEDGDAAAAEKACIVHVSNAADAAWKGLQNAHKEQR
jgi:GntR family transcriptional regulator, trigonelline degradation regulator